MVEVSDKTYRVVVTRERGAWMADVPELAGAHTFARNIPSLDMSVREVIAMVEDLPDGAEDSLSLAYEFQTGIPAIDDATSRLRADRDRIRREEKDLAARTAQIARELVTRYSMSVRDAAALTGVTKQRISQVAPSKAPVSTRRHRARTPA
jgi:hypothetical protein